MTATFPQTASEKGLFGYDQCLRALSSTYYCPRDYQYVQNSSGGIRKDELILDFVRFDRIYYQNTRLFLRESRCLFLLSEDGFYTIEDQALDIYVCERTRAAAISTYHECFAFEWEQYAKEEDECLSAKAIERKQRLLGLAWEMSGDADGQSQGIARESTAQGI